MLNAKAMFRSYQQTKVEAGAEGALIPICLKNGVQIDALEKFLGTC